MHQIVHLMDAGMTVARLNFSHGDHARHSLTMAAIQEACSMRPGKNLAVMLDTKGPEIRTGLLKGHNDIELKKGKRLRFTTDQSHLEGTKDLVACSYMDLCNSVQVGTKVLVADGSLVMIITGKLYLDCVLCIVLFLISKPNTNPPPPLQEYSPMLAK